MFVSLLFACAAPVPDGAARVAALVRQLENGSPGERVIAAELLGDLGPGAAPAAPALARAALNTRYSETIGVSLRITNKADQFLFNACHAALVRIGPKADDDLAKLLDHEEEFARSAALFHYHHGPTPPASAIPILVRRLRGDSSDDISIAAELLGRLGPAAADAVPDLVRLFSRGPHKFGLPLPDTFVIVMLPRCAAVQALLRIGPKGRAAVRADVLPVVIAELKTGTWGWDVLPLLGEDGAPALPAVVEWFRKEKNPTHRVAFAELLPGLGPDGRKAFATLVNARDADTRRIAVLALGGGYRMNGLSPNVIREFVPQLIAACRKGEVADRVAAVHALAQLGTAAPPDAVEAVAALLDDRTFLDALVANGSISLVNFVYDLARFPCDRVRLPEAAVRVGNATVRTEAVRALGRPEARGPRTLALLRRVATEDPDADVAVRAADTAAGISLDPADVLPMLARGAFRGRTKLAPQVGWTLAGRTRHELAWQPEPPSTPDPDHVPALVERLRASAGADFPEEVIDRVAALGPVAAPDAVPVLIELVPKLEARNATHVMNALTAMGPLAADAVPVVVRRLAGEDEAWHIPAALCLADLGRAAKAAVPALRERLTDPDPDVRLAVLYALSRVAGEKDEFRAAFERAVRRGDAFPAELFARAAPHAPDLIPVAARWLETGQPDAALAVGLAKYGPAAKEAVPGLRRAIRDPRAVTDVRREACRALAALGPAAREAIPDLRVLMENATDHETALAARDAIDVLRARK